MPDSFPHPRSRAAASTALLIGSLGVAGSYAVAGSDPTFVVAPVNSLVVDTMPATVLAVSILVLGEVGDLLGFLLSLAVTVGVLAVVTVAAFGLGRRYGTAAAVGTAYFGGWGVTALLTGAPWVSLGVGVPMAAAVALVRLRPLDEALPVDGSRRFVLRLVGVAGVSTIAYVLGHRRPFRTPPRLSVIPAAEQAEIKRRLGAARAKSLAVEGLTGLVSPVDEFYEVDIDTINPAVGAEEWSLSVTGAVGTRLTLTYDDLVSRPPTHRFSTLRCVGEPLNGELMDTALWTGVPVAAVLADAGPTDGATHVTLHAADGYYETFPLAAIQDGLLAYGMNGYLLPRAHGYPVRVLVPGHWGEVNVKWVTEIELLEREAGSYWEKRGWHGTGPVNTVAKLHAQNRLDDGRMEVGGHAYAGTRGIREVQVSVDGGPWETATLSDPLPDADTWRQWRFAYDPPERAHEVVARAVDGTGTRQPQRRAQAFPNGATGWVSVRVEP